MNRSSNESRPVVGKVFVGGLNRETTEAELRAAFAPFGDIAKLQIVRQRNGQSKRYGFVTFSDFACAQAAIADKHHTMFMGERITVEHHGGKFIKGASRDSQKYKVFVDGFHTDTTDEQLRELFSTVGEVRDIEISAKRRLPGSQYAVIQFVTESAQKQAVRHLNDHVLNGDTLFVRPHVSNERRGSTANSEDSTPAASQSRPPDDLVPYSRRRKLFLGNLPSSTSKKEIEELVAKRCPKVTVTSVEYRNANRDRKVTFGFVELADFHQAEVVLSALRDYSWKGRRIHPEFQLGKKHERSPDPYRLSDIPKDMRLAKVGGGFCLERIQRTLHVSPIPAGVTETQIRRKFESYGTVDRVKAVADGGYAYVEFAHVEAAVEARDSAGNTKWDKDQTSFIEVLLSRPSSKDLDRCAIEDPALAAVVAHVTGMRCPKAVPRDIHWSHYMPGEGGQQVKPRWADGVGTSVSRGRSPPPRPLPQQRSRHNDDPGKRILLLARGFPWDIRLEEIQSIIDHEGRIPTADVRWISSQEQPPAVAAEYRCFEDAEWALSRLKGLRIAADLARMRVRFLANDHEDIRAFDAALHKPKLPGGVLMIRNLPESVSNEHLRGRFSLYGQVRRVKTCVDARGRRMGFGFIEMVHPTEAAVALEVLSGTNWEDRQIQVEFAKKQDKAFEDGKNVSFPADDAPAVTRGLEQMSVSRREPGLAPGPGREARGIGAPSPPEPIETIRERDLAPGTSMPFRDELVAGSHNFNSFYSTNPAATNGNHSSSGLSATFSDQHKNDLSLNGHEKSKPPEKQPKLAVDEQQEQQQQPQNYPWQQYEVVRGGRPTYGF